MKAAAIVELKLNSKPMQHILGKLVSLDLNIDKVKLASFLKTAFLFKRLEGEMSKSRLEHKLDTHTHTHSAGPHLHSEHLEVVVLSPCKLLVAEVGVGGEAFKVSQVSKESCVFLLFQV